MKNERQFDFSSVLKFLGNADNSQKQSVAEKMKENLSKEETNELDSILKDKRKIDAILQSDAAKKIIDKLNSGNDGKHK